MDGLTCTRKIRELEAEGKLTGHVPIIAVTANARAEQVQTALDAGMVSTDHSPTSDHLQMRPVRWCALEWVYSTLFTGLSSTCGGKWLARIHGLGLTGGTCMNRIFADVLFVLRRTTS